MISKIAAAVSDWLVVQDAIADKDKRLYAYAVYSVLFGMTPVAIIVILGLIFGMLREGLLLIMPFILLRKFSGGYHLHSPLVCVITSTILLSISLLSVWLVIDRSAVLFLSLLVILATTTLFWLSPIDSKARRLSEKETQVFRSIARSAATLFLVVYLLLVIFNNISVAVPIGVGVIIPALLQLPCVIQWLIARHFAKGKDE